MKRAFILFLLLVFFKTSFSQSHKYLTEADLKNRYPDNIFQVICDSDNVKILSTEIECAKFYYYFSGESVLYSVMVPSNTMCLASYINYYNKTIDKYGSNCWKQKDDTIVTLLFNDNKWYFTYTRM